MDAFVKSSSQCTDELHENAKRFQTEQIESLTASSQRITGQLENIEHSLKLISTRDAAETEALVTVKKILKETRETFNTGFTEWGQRVQKSYDSMHRDVGKIASLSLGEAETALKAIYALLENALQETFKFIETERRTSVEANTLSQETASREIARLRSQNEQLTQLLTTQQLESARAKDDLIQRMSSMLTEFINKQDRGLREGLASVQQDNQAAEEDIKTYADRHCGVMEGLNKENEAITTTLRRVGGDSKRTRDGALKVCETENIPQMIFLTLSFVRL